jgi:fatty-acyl-CoA synthase
MLLRKMVDSFGDKNVSVLRHGSIERCTFLDIADRAGRAATWLRSEGLREGDRVATLLWNSREHLELFLAVPAMGCVLHMVNVRLPAGAISAMLAETRPKVLVADVGFAHLVQQLTLPPETKLVAFVCDDSMKAEPVRSHPGVRHADLRAAVDAAHPFAWWPNLDEDSACGICYTSGTSGKAKGVVYSHRSTILHAMAMLFRDGIALSEHDTCLPVVPMFHAQGWGFPYGACLCGADLALSYRVSDPVSLTRLIRDAGVTLATAVPTVWIALLGALRSGEVSPDDLQTLRRLPVGGASVSSDLIEGFASFGIEVQHCWGMTEVSPLGLVSTRRSMVADGQWAALRLTAGLPQIGCEVRVMTETGDEAPRDGITPGELQIRGPWVADAYFDGEDPDGQRTESSFAQDSSGGRWLRTGDVAARDALGYVKILDRAKDLIKSGGEWISSLELESALATHPSVHEAAVVPVPDPVWQERPLAYVSLNPHWTGGEPDLGSYLAQRFPRWQVPERFIYLQELPKGSTGKIDKTRLRALSSALRKP